MTFVFDKSCVQLSYWKCYSHTFLNSVPFARSMVSVTIADRYAISLPLSRFAVTNSATILVATSSAIGFANGDRHATMCYRWFPVIAWSMLADCSRPWGRIMTAEEVPTTGIWSYCYHRWSWEVMGVYTKSQTNRCHQIDQDFPLVLISYSLLPFFQNF